MSSWHNTDAFWDEYGSHMFHEKRWERTPSEVDGVVTIGGLTPGSKVLDLPCGPGRHSLELARRGYRITGVDRTRGYLDQARSKANAEWLNIEWVQSDMREFRRESAFDAAINLYTSFGYFEDQAENRRVLANFRASLKAGGVFIMETLGKEVLARTFKERIWEERPDGSLYLAETKVSRHWSWVESKWRLIRDGVVKEHVVSHYVYSAVELIAMLTDAGFGEFRTFGSLAGTPFDHAAERMVIAARAV